HASFFHWKQYLDLHFDQWDFDKYLELSCCLYSNYMQMLGIIKRYTTELDLFKHTKDIRDEVFEAWHQEELQFLQNCVAEADLTALAV
ncbi:hypothetical protein HYDPIDRAFT_85591, partial [Hydnomerulius pinastri MD-312]